MVLGHGCAPHGTEWGCWGSRAGRVVLFGCRNLRTAEALGGCQGLWAQFCAPQRQPLRIQQGGTHRPQCLSPDSRRGSTCPRPDPQPPRWLTLAGELPSHLCCDWGTGHQLLGQIQPLWHLQEVRGREGRGWGLHPPTSLAWLCPCMGDLSSHTCRLGDRGSCCSESPSVGRASASLRGPHWSLSPGSETAWRISASSLGPDGHQSTGPP